MKIAVSGVKYVSYPQTKTFAEFGNASEHLGKLAAWDGAIHTIVVRANVAHGTERCLAACPKP